MALHDNVVNEEVAARTGGATSPDEDAKARVVKVMKDALRERFDIDASNVPPDQSLENLGLDSLAFVEYVFELEKRFGIELPDVPRDLVKVDDFATFLVRHLAAASRPAA